MYPKLPSNFRIYADKQSELDLKFNHELCQIQDDYLQKNPELKPEVCWVYGDSPTNNDIWVQNWIGRTAFVIYLYDYMYIDYDMYLNALYLRNINTNDFNLEECDFHIRDTISRFNVKKIAISCSMNPFEFSRYLSPERLSRLHFLNKITQVVQV
jgi:hypothetical protein